MLSEQHDEICRRVKARELTDAVDRFLCGVEQIDGMVKAQVLEIIAEGHMNRVAEQLAEIVQGQIDHPRALAERDRFAEVFLQISGSNGYCFLRMGKKRLLAILLVFATVATVLCACKNSVSSGDGSTAATTAAGSYRDPDATDPETGFLCPCFAASTSFRPPRGIANRN